MYHSTPEYKTTSHFSLLTFEPRSCIHDEALEAVGNQLLDRVCSWVAVDA